MLERSEASLPGWALRLFASLKSDNEAVLFRVRNFESTH